MFKPVSEFKVENKTIGMKHPTYFIADVAANHDGDLGRAKELIYMCKEAGADAAKFQHFAAKSIVSDYGFKNLGTQQSHQAKWEKSVYDVYNDASLKADWTPILKETCDKAGITFFTSPYSFELIEEVDKYIPAYKIGSGDITWPQIIDYMGKKGKPLFLACGASDLRDVDIAVKAMLQRTGNICLMQCNTNYTASLGNFKYINLNVLNVFRDRYPGMILGLSDHTPGHATVLGAVTLGARAIEKHFTDDNNRKGPDHKFAMNPQSWREMVERTRELEAALGDGIKTVEDNEKDTVIIQRRSIRVKADVRAGDVLQSDMLEVLRPCPPDAFKPSDLPYVMGKKAKNDIKKGDCVRRSDLEVGI